jgi:hypothetical protein
MGCVFCFTVGLLEARAIGLDWIGLDWPAAHVAML